MGSKGCVGGMNNRGEQAFAREHKGPAAAEAAAGLSWEMGSLVRANGHRRGLRQKRQPEKAAEDCERKTGE